MSKYLKTKILLTSTFLVRPARHSEALRRGGRVFDIQKKLLNYPDKTITWDGALVCKRFFIYSGASSACI
jgi:hypothetical protein